MFHEESQGKSHISLSPKQSFLIGLVVGILALCTIGFFILLSVVLKNGISSAGAANPSDSQYAGTTTPTPIDDTGSGDQVGTVTPVSKDDHVRGAESAKVTLIEYSDFQCPYCERFHPTMQQLMKEYQGKVKWVYRHYPLSFHPNALPSANAAECASEQGKFWEYADQLFGNQDKLSDTYYPELAKQLGLNAKKFGDCYAAKKYNARVQSDQAGGNTAGVTGTPGTIILGVNGSKQLVPGAVPYETLKQMVDSALQN